MRIAELFHSLQGEGKLIGLPSVFIRTSGCNLRCTWCDTPYASWHPDGSDLSLDHVLTQTLAHPSRHVVITGGEPLMFPDLPVLVRRLHDAGRHITIETAGTLWQDFSAAGGLDLASISPKLANSTPWQRDAGRFAKAHESHRLSLDVLRQFATSPHIRERQWKFVVSAPEDLAEIQSLLAQLPPIPPDDILLMPEGTTQDALSAKAPWLADLCQRHGYRFCLRLHIALYGNQRGT